MTPVARTKAAIRRDKRQQAAQGDTQGQEALQASDTAEKLNNAPTPEQQRRGAYVRNKPPGARAELWLNTAPDCLASLHVTGRITDAQEQAGRYYEMMRLAYIKTLGIGQGRSCLDMTPWGYDETEDSGELQKVVRQLERDMGRVGTAVVRGVVVEGRYPKASHIEALRAALDAIS